MTDPLFQAMLLLWLLLLILLLPLLLVLLLFLLMNDKQPCEVGANETQPAILLMLGWDLAGTGLRQGWDLDELSNIEKPS